MQTFDKVMVGIVAAIFMFCCFGAYMHTKQVTRFQETCAAKGGVPFMPKRAWICLKKDMVQP